MSSSTSATRRSEIKETPQVVIKVDEHAPLSQVRDAQTIAKSYGAQLTTFKETVMRFDISRGSSNAVDLSVGTYAVDSKDLPEQALWHFIDRDNSRFLPITKDRAEELMFQTRWSEVLCVYEDALDAAKDGRAVALYADFGSRGRDGQVGSASHLAVVGAPHVLARAVVSIPKIAANLRKDSHV